MGPGMGSPETTIRRAASGMRQHRGHVPLFTGHAFKARRARRQPWQGFERGKTLSLNQPFFFAAYKKGSSRFMLRDMEDHTAKQRQACPRTGLRAAHARARLLHRPAG